MTATEPRRKKKPSHLLTALSINEVSLVDRPSCAETDEETGQKIPRATIALWKRDGTADVTYDRHLRMLSARVRATDSMLSALQQQFAERAAEGVRKFEVFQTVSPSPTRRRTSMSALESVLKSDSATRSDLELAVQREAAEISKKEGVSIQKAESQIWDRVEVFRAYDAAPYPIVQKGKKPPTKTTDAEQELDKRAKQLQRESGLSYEKCYEKACTERPELVRKAEADTLRGLDYVLEKSDSDTCPECDGEIGAGDKFCPQCGQKLAAKTKSR